MLERLKSFWFRVLATIIIYMCIYIMVILHVRIFYREILSGIMFLFIILEVI